MLPHNTPFGRAALRLPESLEQIPGYVRTAFWQDRAAFLQPTPLASCQSFSRGNIFQSLNRDDEGLAIIGRSGIVGEITRSLTEAAPAPESVLFRGHIISFAQIATTDGGFRLFSAGAAIFDKVCGLALTRGAERCRHAAVTALSIMAENPSLAALIRGRFNLRLVRLRNAEHFVVGCPRGSPGVYSRQQRQRPRIFDFRGESIDFAPAVQLAPARTAFYSQPTSKYAGMHEEAGIQFQPEILTDFSVLTRSGLDRFLCQGRRRDVANQFAAEVELLRLRHARVEAAHLPPEAQEAVKLCFVENVADARAGLVQLRQGYQKSPQLDLFLLLEISRRHVEPGVLAEIYDIVGRVGLDAGEWMDGFAGEWA